MPRPASNQISVIDGPLALVPSSDFNRYLFTAATAYVSAQTPYENGSGGAGVNLFLSEDPFAQPAWLAAPRIAQPTPQLGSVDFRSYAIAGASPDLGTVYFTYEGTLIGEDQAREANVAAHRTSESEVGFTGPWGFYEWSGGGLVSAGALPDGTYNPFGAAPAAIAGSLGSERGFLQAEMMDNQVSRDGTRTLFVSPDPGASTVTNGERCSSEPPCTSEPPQLYLRERGPAGGHVSVLVSRSQLPGHEGQAAPDGVVRVPFASATARASSPGGYAYGSPDGSQAFFASTDRLTADAPEGSEVKEYDFDAASGAVTYLPGLKGPIGLVSPDGSQALFVDDSASPSRLELWRRGPGGGSVAEIAELPMSSVAEPDLSQAHLSADGSVLVFRTNAAIPGFNDAGEYEQVYRYDETSNELTCVSCPPSGVASTGDARMSYNNAEPGVKGNGGFGDPATTIETRGISGDGDRVFFDTSSPLLAQDTNGVRDVYEWRSGALYLISTGASFEESLVLDSGESGGDVFFATAQGLVPGDTDETYDVYDARVPRPGTARSQRRFPAKARSARVRRACRSCSGRRRAKRSAARAT